MIGRSATRFPRLASFVEQRLTNLRERLWMPGFLHRPDVAALALPGLGVIVLAEIGADLPLRITALVLTCVCWLTRPALGVAVILVAASDPSLFRGHAFGPLTVVDLLTGAVIVRAALMADRRRPNRLEWLAVGFLVAGGVATAVSHSGSAPTAFARVGSYLALGLIVGRALGFGDRPLLMRAFVGSEAGQAFAALTSITSTTATDFPFGRYLGTLGDPAQFGIPIAFAAVLLAASRNIVRDTVLRAALLILFAAAVAGSATRSAWAVAAVGGLLTLARRGGSGRAIELRIALAAALLAALSVGTVLVVVGAGAIGLNPSSAELRRRSVETAWTYLTAHPFHPTGLGNNPTGRVDEVVAPVGANLIPDSGFERGAQGWVTFREADVRRSRADKISGTASLSVRTEGKRIEEGVATAAPVLGMRGNSTYTFSIYAKARPKIRLWLYIDEYDANTRWLTYGYSRITGTGDWTRVARTWKTKPATAQSKVFVVTGERARTAFFVDAAQLERGGSASPYIAGRQYGATQPSATYNTWLSVAVSLGIIAAGFLAVLAAGAPYHAHRLGHDAVAIALVAILVPSLTENFMYAASVVTLVWLAALGLTVTAQASVGGACPVDTD